MFKNLIFTLPFIFIGCIKMSPVNNIATPQSRSLQISTGQCFTCTLNIAADMSFPGGTCQNVACAIIPPPPPIINMWFIRTDGGTAIQCDGKTDSALNSNGHCAFSNPYYLWGNDVYGEKAKWKIAGGDTVIIHAGKYRMGYKTNASSGYWGQCPGDPYDCYMPTIPAGTASQHTKIIGDDMATTQLHGGYAVVTILNLKGAQYVDVSNLELTDYSSCEKFGTGTIHCSSNYPLDDYATNGILTDTTTHDIQLTNINIHGLTSRGIIGPIGGNISVSNVTVAYNGGAGWDFDDGNGTPSVNGNVVASKLSVQWNGCNEEYPIVDQYPAKTCYDQNSAGYGDGIGTPNTPLNFSCDHCTFNHNTQDGFDLLHTSGSTISVSNSTAYANMGQQWKLGAMNSVSFINNETIHNCQRMSQAISGAPTTFNKGLSNFCRAAGEGIRITLLPTGIYTLENNSFVGYGSTSYAFGCSTSDCSKAQVNFQNNLNAAYAIPGQGTLLPGLFYFDPGVTASVWHTRSNNIYYNFRNGCPTGFTGETCTIPLTLPIFANEAALDSINFTPLIFGSGISLSNVLTDINGKSRRSPPDIGALEH